MTKLCFSIDDPAESLHLQFLKDHAQDFKKHSELLHQLIPDNLMLLDYLLTFPDLMLRSGIECGLMAGLTATREYYSSNHSG